MRSINKNDIIWAYVHIARERRNSITYGVPYYIRNTGALGLNTNAVRHISESVPLGYHICQDKPMYDAEGVYIGSFESGRLRPKDSFT